MMADSIRDEPLISIIIATHNSENTLRACLDSLQSNLVELERPEEVEILFIDGDSTDQTVDIIRSYNIGKTLTYPARGMEDAFNRGVENAQGHFVTFLHSDDEYSPGYLGGLLHHARRYGGRNVVIYTSVMFIDEAGKELYTRRPAPYVGFIQRYQAIIFHPNALYPTQLVRRFPFEILPENLPSDRQEVYRLMHHARAVRDRSISYRFRISDNSWTVEQGRSEVAIHSVPLTVGLMRLIGRTYIQAYETRLLPRLLALVVKRQTPWRASQIETGRDNVLYALTLVAHGRNALFLQARLLNSVLGSASGMTTEVHATGQLNQRLALREIALSRAPVIYHYGSFDPFAFLFVRRARTVFVYHNQTPAGYYWRWRPQAALLVFITNLQLRLFPKDVQWIAVSEFNRQHLRQFGFQRVGVCPCIVTGSKSDSVSDKTDAPSLIFVGRIDPSKNCIELLSQVSKAACSLQRKVTLRLVGGTKSGCSYGVEFRKQVLLYSSDPWLEIQWHSGMVSQEELDALYASSWLYVSTSLHEGFGLPVCESIAQGTPALYLECGGTESILGANGMVPLSQSREFGEHVLHFVASQTERDDLLDRQQKIVQGYMSPRIDEIIKQAYATIVEELHGAS